MRWQGRDAFDTLEPWNSVQIQVDAHDEEFDTSGIQVPRQRLGSDDADSDSIGNSLGDDDETEGGQSGEDDLILGGFAPTAPASAVTSPAATGPAAPAVTTERYSLRVRLTLHMSRTKLSQFDASAQQALRSDLGSALLGRADVEEWFVLREWFTATAPDQLIVKVRVRAWMRRGGVRSLCSTVHTPLPRMPSPNPLTFTPLTRNAIPSARPNRRHCYNTGRPDPRQPRDRK